jgi:hypothetical protein
MKALVLACLVFGIGAVGLATAKENYKETGVKADTKEAFDPLAANVRKEMETGGRYEYVKPTERTTIDKKLDEMTQLFQQAGAVANMTEVQKIALYNDQEVVNSILTQRDRDRVICVKEAPVGSHIPVTKCHTYAQEVEAREGTKKQMADWKLAPCVGDNLACHAQ